MAGCFIEHSCGHTVEHQLYGPGRNRQRKKEWLASVPCMDCKRAADEEARNKANARAARSNKRFGCAKLEGTEKQVAWAETLRHELLAVLRKGVGYAKKNGDTDPEIKECFVYALQWAEQIKEASWWIDHRRTQYINAFTEPNPIAMLGRILDRRGAPNTAPLEDRLQELLVLCPHTTKSMSIKLGLNDPWADKMISEQEEAAKKEADEIRQRKLAESRERMSALGISCVNVGTWGNGDKRCYIEGDGIADGCYYRDGNNYHGSGALTGVRRDKDQIKEMSEWMCETWGSTKIKR